MSEPLPFESPPLSARVVVAVDEPPTRIGSLVLPDKIQDRPSSGVVVEVGPAAPEGYLGRRIVFGQSAGVRVKIGERWFLVLAPDDVLALLPAGTPAPWGSDAAA
jgi:co-chaperonin GroES (HSP10)